MSPRKGTTPTAGMPPASAPQASAPRAGARSSLFGWSSMGALALGAIHAISFAPWPAWWLQAAALTAMLWLLMRRAPGRSRRDWGDAFAFGTAWFAIGMGWLYVSMHDVGGLPAPLALLAVLILAIYLGAFPAVAMKLTAGIARRMPRLGAASLLATGLVAAGAWSLAEWLRGWLLTGLPWLSIGYAQIDGPLAGWAPLLGVYGVGAMTALPCASIALFLARRTAMTRAAGWTAALLILLPPALGAALSTIIWSQPHGEPLTVRLLQGNVAQSLKFDPAHSTRAMLGYLAMIRAADADLTVLPETAWTVPWPATAPEIARSLYRPGDGLRTAVALGAPMPPKPDSANDLGDDPLRLRITNSVILLERQGDEARIAAQYDKHHLVPFGEFIPRGFAWFVRLMQIPLGSFDRGRLGQEPMTLRGQRIAFNICYEDLFGAELTAPFRRAIERGDASTPTILINVSNLAWFGDSLALPQHLQIARMRAIETARPMLRATNTGVTAAIDERGRVLSRLPVGTQGILEQRVQGMSGDTPYARHGDWPVVALGALALLIGFLLARRRHTGTPSGTQSSQQAPAR